MPNNTKKSPYHNVRVTNGTYGELSKIQEELDEAVDAEIRGLDLLVLIELADVIGAVAGVAEEQYGFDLDQLIAFSEMVREVKSKEAEAADESMSQARQLLEAAKTRRREMEGGWWDVCKAIWDNPSDRMGKVIGLMQAHFRDFPDHLPLMLEDLPPMIMFNGSDGKGPVWSLDIREGGFNSEEIELLKVPIGCKTFAEFLTNKFKETAPKPEGLKGQSVGEDGSSKPLISLKDRDKAKGQIFTAEGKMDRE